MRLQASGLCAALALAALVSSVAAAQSRESAENARILRGARARKRSAIAAFVCNYVASAGVGAFGSSLHADYSGSRYARDAEASRTAAGTLFAPLVGPWIAVGIAPTGAGRALYVAAGVIQLSSFGWMVERIVHHRRHKHAVTPSRTHGEARLALDFVVSPARAEVHAALRL